MFLYVFNLRQLYLNIKLGFGVKKVRDFKKNEKIVVWVGG